MAGSVGGTEHDEVSAEFAVSVGEAGDDCGVAFERFELAEVAFGESTGSGEDAKAGAALDGDGAVTGLEGERFGADVGDGAGEAVGGAAGAAAVAIVLAGAGVERLKGEGWAVTVAEADAAAERGAGGGEEGAKGCGVDFDEGAPAVSEGDDGPAAAPGRIDGDEPNGGFGGAIEAA